MVMSALAFCAGVVAGVAAVGGAFCILVAPREQNPVL